MFLYFFGLLPSVGQARELVFPPAGYALDAVERGVLTVAIHGSSLVLTVPRRDFFIVTPFHGFGEFSDKSFGNHLASQRVTIDKDFARGNWQGVIPLMDRLYFFDGDELEVAVFDAQKFTLIGRRTTPWDRVRPAADRGGEATRSETAQLRKKFHDVYFASPSSRFSGFAYDEGQWLGNDALYFFVTTGFAGFPLVTMRCAKDELASCSLDRVCRVSGVGTSRFDGVVVDQKRRELLMLNAHAHKIDRVKFQSCFASQYVDSMQLPSKMRQATSMTMSDDVLWISSNLPDDYHNASVYAFKDWR
jgi:hypothetical protein